MGGSRRDLPAQTRGKLWAWGGWGHLCPTQSPTEVQSRQALCSLSQAVLEESGDYGLSVSIGVDLEGNQSGELDGSLRLPSLAGPLLVLGTYQ